MGLKYLAATLDGDISVLTIEPKPIRLLVSCALTFYRIPVVYEKVAHAEVASLSTNMHRLSSGSGRRFLRVTGCISLDAVAGSGRLSLRFRDSICNQADTRNRTLSSASRFEQVLWCLKSQVDARHPGFDLITFTRVVKLMKETKYYRLKDGC